MTQFVWTAPHTSIDAQFSVAHFAHPEFAFRYRGRLDLEDVRTILRKPSSPSGRVGFTGNGKYAEGKLGLTGGFSAEAIAMRFQWFHARDLSSRGSYRADKNTLEVPDLSVRGLGGGINGRVHLDFRGLQFRVDAHAQDMDLASIMGAVDNPSLPIKPLHWGGVVDVQSVTQWAADFKNLDSRGVTTWKPAAVQKTGEDSGQCSA